MEFFKKIALLILLVIMFLVMISNLPKLLVLDIGTDNVNNEEWYDSTHYLYEYYLADSGGDYDTGAGYQYYLADSQISPVKNSDSLVYTGSVYYNSDYGTYADEIYAQYEDSDMGYNYYQTPSQYGYDDPDRGYAYYKEYKNLDGFDDEWDKYLDN